jgi:hypothetical protein
MRVMNWSNIFVNQWQFSNPDFISGTHRRENVQFAEKCYLSVNLMCPQSIHGVIVSMLTSSVIYHGFKPWSGQTKDY